MILLLWLAIDLVLVTFLAHLIVGEMLRSRRRRRYLAQMDADTSRRMAEIKAALLPAIQYYFR